MSVTPCEPKDRWDPGFFLRIQGHGGIAELQLGAFCVKSMYPSAGKVGPQCWEYPYAWFFDPHLAKAGIEAVLQGRGAKGARGPRGGRKRVTWEVAEAAVPRMKENGTFTYLCKGGFLGDVDPMYDLRTFWGENVNGLIISTCMVSRPLETAVNEDFRFILCLRSYYLNMVYSQVKDSAGNAEVFHIDSLRVQPIPPEYASRALQTAFVEGLKQSFVVRKLCHARRVHCQSCNVSAPCCVELCACVHVGGYMCTPVTMNVSVALIVCVCVTYCSCCTNTRHCPPQVSAASGQSSSILMPDPSHPDFGSLAALTKVVGWRDKMVMDPDWMKVLWPLAGNHRCAARHSLHRLQPALYNGLAHVRTTTFNLMVGLGPAMAKEAGKQHNDTGRKQADETLLDKMMVSL